MIIDGQHQTSDLCSVCFESVGPPYARDMAARMRNAKCDFCGAPAAIGGPDSLARSVGIERFQCRCFTCSQDYHDYLQGRLESLSCGLSQEEQVAAIRALLAEVDAHVKQKALEREK